MMFQPISTYRIQLHRDFSFTDLEACIPYLQEMGVHTLYASPIFEALPGSTHGYDVVNPNAINPEIGTLEEFRRLRQKLSAAGIYWLQDIVPNHMSYHQCNSWLMDVLEKGPQSVYAGMFDIGWNSKLFKGRLMAPFLARPLDEAIEKDEIKLAYRERRFVLSYFESWYPLKPGSYSKILQAAPPNDATQSLLGQIENLHQTEDSNVLQKGWEEVLLQLQSLMKNEQVQGAIRQAMDGINNEKAKLRDLESEQHYRLCHWLETDERINYRRFFLVNSLICLNIQDPAVLQLHHALVKQLVAEGWFQGLRIDHIDGLYDPAQYLHELRNLCGKDMYTVVEKILEPGEALPEDWPVDGTTGYDFLAAVNNLLTNHASESAFTDFYQELTADYSSIEQQTRNKKYYILSTHMGGELENLYQLFQQLSLADKRMLASIPSEDLKSVIGEFLVLCPVYRFYGTEFPLSGSEEAAVRGIIQSLRNSEESQDAVSLLETVLLKRPYEGNAELNDRILQFYQRCMQFTGPLMAKGVEDTLMYTYNRLLAHNEVGDSPQAFGEAPEAFHQKMKLRREKWPHSLNATATHDTKRGEDARARLNVLSDLGAEWLQKVGEWKAMNLSLKQNAAPDDNDEYLLYQALIAHYPVPGEEENGFINRLQDYLQKAIRESKRRSDWARPDEAYEKATKDFAAALLDKNGAFWKSFFPFLQTVTDAGMLNSLSQLVLKFTCPGIPDVYQGCEGWDFSFVDPDNRRPVNFQQRMQALTFLDSDPDAARFETLWANRAGGTVKLWLVRQLLQLRKLVPELFTEGEYIPLKAEGRYKAEVIAFARRHHGTVYVVALPLHFARLCHEQKKGFFEIDWKDTRINLPREIEGELEFHFTKIKLAKGKGLRLQDLFRELPFAILRGRQTANERGAGVLLHLTSLPAAFGVGDLGPEARNFADFLYRSRQKFWQVLPLNPTESGQGHSPYSALSSKAGYPLLISPELLVADELLTPDNLSSYQVPAGNQANFAAAETAKAALLEKAFANFCAAKEHPLHEPFRNYQKKEKGWLDDFALFMLLKTQNEGKPWYEWPDLYKKRSGEALKKLAHQHPKELRNLKWQQFVFDRQWHELRRYCNARNIRLIGDIPFYVSYDSADVWSHQELFALDENGNRTGMAGVPPDIFSEDGQLWGMPVFKWDVLQQTGYQWWIERMKKNMEAYDLVRLDHFRAFADYWVVPQGEQTAKTGQWVNGPGAAFFQALEAALGALPLVAEDLGDIDEKVLNLRDDFQLPGMKVLQFAFNEDMPQSDHIPHNHKVNAVVYSGTHDNNTSIGWFRTDADDAVRNRVRQYAGMGVDEGNIHHVLARLAYGSVACMAILPMQDILGLDETARMNRPSSGANNWAWRLTPGQITSETENQLQEWTRLYNRQ